MRFKKLWPAVLILMFLVNTGRIRAQHIRFFAGAGAALLTAEAAETGFASGFGAGLKIHDGMWLQLEYLHWTNDIRDHPDFELLSGRLYSTPFLLSLNIEFLPNKPLTPVLKAGAGYMFNRVSIGNVISIPEVTFSQSLKSGFSFYGGGGLIVRMMKNISLNLEACGVFRKASGITTVHDMNTGDSRETFSVSLNALLLQAGIIYLF